MSDQEQATTASYFSGARSTMAPHRDEVRLRIGLRFDRRITAPGVLEP